MAQRMRIGAGVLHYRFWPGVRETIDALLGQTRRPDHILVVDHASADGSAQLLREAYPEVEVLELEENRGPTAGMNRVLHRLLAQPVDAVLILPHDIEFAPDAVEHLAARLEQDSSLGAVGPLVAHKRARERVFYAGGHVDPRTWDLEFREHPSALSDWRGKPPRSVDFLEFGGILLRTEAAAAVGGLPEKFYYLHDDVDFTLRIASRGWRLECVPAAVAWQDLGDPARNELVAPLPPYLRVRNRLGLIARNAPRRMVAREVLRVLAWLARDALRPPHGSRAELWPRFRGLVDFCLNRWGPPPPGVAGRRDSA